MPKAKEHQDNYKADTEHTRTVIDTLDKIDQEIDKSIKQPVKPGAPFKYSKADGTIDIARIQDVIDGYFEQRDKIAQRLYATKNKLDKDNPDDLYEMDSIRGQYSIAGICVALGICRDQLSMWAKGLTTDQKFDSEGNDISIYNYELADAVKKAKMRVVESLEEMRNGNNAMSIFLLKNHAGYTDVQQQEVTGTIAIDFNLGKLGNYAK